MIEHVNGLISRIDRMNTKKHIVSSEIQRERLRKHPDFQFFMQCIYKNAPDLPLTDMIVD